MNTLIATINHWGGLLLQFTGPMLWQSSLLIGLVFALDLLFARKIRASVRYALWLAVLAKLLLPPTLALPTGVAWWLFPAKPAVTAPAYKNFTVTYDNAPPQMNLIPPTSATPAPPAPKLKGAGWTFLASTTVSLGLLFWLAFRWWQVVGKVRGTVAGNQFSELLDDAARRAGLHSRVRLKISDHRLSPAVCGLFRPVILLPRALAEKLPSAQLRAVLLHELFHLRRRDVWVNCVQALLQIFYWWHPLLWLANARIRRLREEAVDDAVMLALRDEADGYAPTLLAVAKLAFRRPRMSLGLVGIMESRSALRQRIERLVDFRAPRKAGLTFVSLCGIFAFSAVALPMGEGPAATQNESPPATVPVVTTHISIPPTNLPAVFIAAEIYRMRADDFQNAISDLRLNQNPSGHNSWWLATPEQFSKLQTNLHESAFQPLTRPRIQTSSGMPAELFVGNDEHGTEFDCLPVVSGGQINLSVSGKITDAAASGAETNQFSASANMQNHAGMVIRADGPSSSTESNLVVLIGVEMITNHPAEHYQQRLVPLEKKGSTNAAGFTGRGRQAILAKLQTIRLDKFSTGSSALPLNEVLKQLVIATRMRDPERTGINFLVENNEATNSSPPPDGPVTAVDPTTGLPATANLGSATPDADLGWMPIAINPPLNNLTLEAALNAVVKAAPKPIQYSVQDFAVVFSSKKNLEPQLYMRTFMVNREKFEKFFSELPYRNLSDATNLPTDVRAMRKFFAQAGVNWATPPGKSLFYNDRRGYLFVKATQSDLDKIEHAISATCPPLAEVHIKARFLEVPKGTLANFSAPAGATNAAAGATRVLPTTNANAVLHLLQSHKGVEILAEPEVTMLSGRQAQLRATETVTIITNLAWQANVTNGSGGLVPETSQVETGPILEVLPRVLSDGYTINLTVTPSDTEFLGYDRTTETTLVNDRSGKQVEVPEVLPRFSVRRVATTLNLWDGQTAMIGGFPEKDYLKSEEMLVKPKASDKELLVLVTANLVDSAGNRIHSDAALPFAQWGVPVQPLHIQK